MGNAEPVSIADEVPFEIPESWEWVTLKTIATSELGKTLDKAKNTGNFHPYLCSINVYWDGIDLSTVKQARFEESELTKYRLKQGDLLICEGGDVGRSAIWNSDQEMYYQNALHRVRFYGGICPDFYLLVLECYKGNNILDDYSKGMTIKHLVQSSLNAIYMPLPPAAEQVRIVEMINRIRPYLHKYDIVESSLDALNSGFPDQLKKSILQMAVQGKLVSQDPDDEPASVLLDRIRAEKERLIAEGKIKRDKNESVIYRRDNSHYEKLGPEERCIDDEIPFELPNSWTWARLSNLVNLLSGQDFEPSGYNSTGIGIPYITGASNIEDGNVIINRWTECPKNIAHNGELLLVCKGAGVGKMAELKEESAHIARQIMAITPIFMSLQYLRIVLEHNLEYLRRNMQGVIPGISRSDVLNLLILRSLKTTDYPHKYCL